MTDIYQEVTRKIFDDLDDRGVFDDISDDHETLKEIENEILNTLRKYL